MDHETYVYVLLDPDQPDLPRYVGQSRQLPRKRLDQHFRHAVKLNEQHHNARWIRKLNRAGRRPLIKVVEVVDPDDVNDRERWWIAHLQALGATLTNCTDGGEGAPNRDAETRCRLSAGMKARATPQWRGAQSARLRASPAVQALRHDEALNATKRANATAHWADPEYKARISTILRTSPKMAARHTPEARQRSREVMQRLWADPEYRARKTEEARIQMIERRKDPDYNRKMEEARRRVSPEVRSAAARKGWVGQDVRGNRGKTHCIRGHEFTEENTWYYPDGRGRQCRACRRINAQERRVANAHPRQPKTHCPRGHAYEGNNLYVTKKGSPVCRTCARERSRAHRDT